VRRRIAIALTTLCVALAASLLTVAAADAHPLGNFTINHFAGIELAGSDVYVRYALDVAEIPTYQRGDEIRRPGYPARLARELRLTLDGRRVPLRVVSHRTAERPGAGGLMQVYRGMDIGTAKATPAERARVPHHLIDLVNPDEEFSAAQYQSVARQAIAEVAERGRLPMLVGGTGLYVRAALDPYQFTEAEVDWEYRRALQELATTHGAEHLHKILAEVDPEAARKLHANDLRRVIRALEVHHHTGEKISDWQAASK
jgi:hypothetical protein